MVRVDWKCRCTGTWPRWAPRHTGKRFSLLFLFLFVPCAFTFRASFWTFVVVVWRIFGGFMRCFSGPHAVRCYWGVYAMHMWRNACSSLYLFSVYTFLFVPFLIGIISYLYFVLCAMFLACTFLFLPSPACTVFLFMCLSVPFFACVYFCTRGYIPVHSRSHRGL